MVKINHKVAGWGTTLKNKCFESKNATLSERLLYRTITRSTRYRFDIFSHIIVWSPGINFQLLISSPDSKFTPVIKQTYWTIKDVPCFYCTLKKGEQTNNQ